MEENWRASHIWTKVRDSLKRKKTDGEEKDSSFVIIFRYLKIVKGEPEIIVLTDLKEQGCFMMDRFEGLDEEHTLLVLNKIAKFHATSVAYKEQVRD